jgi:outer membrane protein TolC
LGHLANLLRKDLPVRQHQAGLGLAAAEARLHQTEVETLYSVTRCYWTVVYAQAQLRQVGKALDKDPKKLSTLPNLRVNLEKARRSGRDDIEKWAVQQFDGLIAATEGRREEALQGVPRAKAALREAIGLDPDCALELADEELPEVGNPAPREQIVALAAAQRGEIIQARIAAEVTGLEVKAQCLSNSLKVETFAAGSDLHAVPLPAPNFGEDYRPGPIGVEMPANLVGNRCLRMEQAEDLHARTLAVLAKTCGLIRLEAENTWLQWEESRAKAEAFEKAATSTEKVSAEVLRALLQDAPENSKATASNVLDNFIRLALLRVQANQARFQFVLYLAALERVTGGGYCPQFRAPEHSENGKEKADMPKDK